MQDLQLEKEKNNIAQKEINELNKKIKCDTVDKFVILYSIGFPIGSDKISSLHRGSLIQLSKFIQENNLQIIVKGY